MRFARLILVLSAAPFAAIGVAFLVFPARMAGFVGLALTDATADADVRAVYGGLQIGCAAFLLAAAANPAWCRAGLAGQLAFYAGLSAARIPSYFVEGLPSLLGFLLHGGELLGLALGILAWRRLERSPDAGVA